MNNNELAAQLQFFKDIGVESLSVEKPSPAAQVRKDSALSQQGEGTRITLDTVRAELGDDLIVPARCHAAIIGTGDGADPLDAAWLLGFIVGILPNQLLPASLRVDVPCAPVAAFVVGAVVYFVCAKMGLQSQVVPIPEKAAAK